MLNTEHPLMNSLTLAGQNILITGAGGRIGSAISKQALLAGARIVLVDISLSSLDRLLTELPNSHVERITVFEGDTATSEGIEKLVTKTIEAVGTLHAAVHSAYPRSKGWGSDFESFDPENLFSDLKSQLGGAILFSRRIIQCFRDQGHGNLIHLSSIQGVQAPKFYHYEGTNMTSPIEYSAIKAGIISMTRWLAKYTANQNIRVNCVSPGGILDSQPSEFLRRYRESCTNIGMLSADNVASLIVFLLSSGAIAINGQNILVDDGWTL